MINNHGTIGTIMHKTGHKRGRRHDYILNI
jgi:hypothetical protein